MDAGTYRLRAFFYDWWWGRYTDRTLSLLLRQAEIGHGDRVVDVGCGTGALEERLLRWYPDLDVTGVDPSTSMLSVAREKSTGLAGVRWVCASAENLPFPDATFDVVLSSSVLHHVGRVDAALAEMRRVLLPGGRLYVLDWARDFLSTRVRDTILRVVDPAHQRCFSSTELRRMLSATGLSVEYCTLKRSGTYGLMLIAAARPR